MKTLVTKLFDTVNDDSLPYLGVVEVSMYESDDSFGIWLSGGTATFTAVNGTLSTSTIDPAKELTLTGYKKTINVSEDVDRILIRGDLDKIDSLSTIVLNDGVYLSYLPSLTNILLRFCKNTELKDFPKRIQNIDCRGGLSGSFADIQSTSLIDLKLYTQVSKHDVSGTTAELKKHFVVNGMKTLIIENNDKITGDIYDIADLISLDTNATVWFSYCPYIGGELNAVIDYLKGKKKNSTLSVRLYGSQVTYNGSKITDTLTFTFDENGNVSQI